MNFREKETKVLKGTHKRATFLVGIPTFGMVSIDWHIAAQRLQMPVNALVESMVIKNMEVGEAREQMAQFYMSIPEAKRPQFLFMFGDDMMPTWDALINLWQDFKDSDYDVMAGLYYLKSDPPIPILWKTEIDGPLMPDKHFKMGDIVDSDICGMDFTLIKPSAFKRIKPPYFLTGPSKATDKKGNETGGVWTHTEDAYFCRKVLQAGGKVGVHTGVRVGHLDVNTGQIY